MFYNNKSTKDGLGRECKDCIGEYEQTDTYKRNRKKYMQSESYKEAEVRGNKKYMQTKKGKESAKRRKWRYLQTANGKKHRDLLKPIVEEYYEMSYVIISNVVTI